MNIEKLIKKTEVAYNHAAEARQAALDACTRCGAYLDKAKQAESDAKQLLNLLHTLKDGHALQDLKIKLEETP